MCRKGGIRVLSESTVHLTARANRLRARCWHLPRRLSLITESATPALRRHVMHGLIVSTALTTLVADIAQ
jgi:hypothetical protein